MKFPQKGFYRHRDHDLDEGVTHGVVEVRGTAFDKLDNLHVVVRKIHPIPFRTNISEPVEFDLVPPEEFLPTEDEGPLYVRVDDKKLVERFRDISRKLAKQIGGR